jgi:hypothetical protein
METTHWRVLGASVQGTSHQKNDRPCQDAHAYRVTEQGVLIIAVADGAGSAEQSHAGATLAVAQAVDALAQSTTVQVPPDDDEAAWKQLMQTAFTTAFNALQAYALQEDLSLRALSTTLTCVLARSNLLVVGQVGDGAVILEATDGSFSTALPPQRGEYANETFFLTTKDMLNHIDMLVQPCAIRSLAVTTDGLLRLAMQMADYTSSPRFFQPVLEFVAEAEDETASQQELIAFLESERVCQRTDDDKTLVLAMQKDTLSEQPG